MGKTWNNKAWFMVLPAMLMVMVSAVIPLMTVVNYSVQDTFGNNEFFWNGTEWFTEVLKSDRFWGALVRNFAFSATILAIEIPLGVFIALNMPRKGMPLTVRKVEDIGRQKIVRGTLAGQAVSIVVKEDSEIPAEPRVTFQDKGINIYADSWRVGQEG